MPGSLPFGAPPPTPQRRQPRWLDLTVFFAVRFLPGSRKWSPRRAAVSPPGSPKTCPCGASCVLHPPCSVTGRPPGTRPACPPNGVSFTTVVLGSEARHECVCPSSSRPGPGAISSPIWRPRSGIQWPQVSRWVPKGPGRPGGWIKAVGEGVALDDLMRGDDPCSGGERCGLGLGTDSLSLCLCPRSVLDAGVRPRLMHARLQAPEKGSFLPTALQPGGRGGGGTG